MSQSQNQSKMSSAGPSTTTDDLSQIEKTMLCFAGNGGARPLIGWRSISYYEVLIKKGYVAEAPEGNILFRRFMLTDKGRDKIVEMTKL